jgi:membrane-associated protease RseP (regulator of RpoE activity)
MAGKIFINYRRDDSAGTAGRLHDRLAQTFGRNNLFMDVDHIPAGVDFLEYLHSQVAACDVFLAVIGPNWLNAKDERGRRRFDNPDDYVTIEIAAALARNIRVIPVLVDGARTPKADRLPDSVKPLVRRNAVEVRNTHFGRDAESLASKVGEALKGARPATGRWPFLASAAARLMVAGSAMALLLVGWIGLYQMGVPVWVPWTPRAEQPDAPGADKAKAAADAEAKRKAEEAEQQRLAALKADEERKAKAAADAEAKRKAEAAQQQLAAVQGRAWLGVRIQQVTDETAENLKINPPRGALVAGVDEKGPAKHAGIEPGDVIVKFDGKDIKEMREVPRVVADTPVGKQVPVVIFRKGKEETKTVTLGRLEDGEKLVAADPKGEGTPDKPVVKKTLGLELANMSDDLRKRYKIKDAVKGVVITGIDANSSAADKRVVPGDVIMEIAQEAVASADDLQAKIDKLKKDGRKSALLLVSAADGELRFVALSLEGR